MTPKKKKRERIFLRPRFFQLKIFRLIHNSCSESAGNRTDACSGSAAGNFQNNLCDAFLGFIYFDNIVWFEHHIGLLSFLNKVVIDGNNFSFRRIVFEPVNFYVLGFRADLSSSATENVFNLKLLGKAPAVNFQKVNNLMCKNKFGRRAASDLNRAAKIYNGQPIRQKIESKAELSYSLCYSLQIKEIIS